jgi:hypothetical protein
MYTLPANAVASSIFFTQYLDTTKDIVVSFDYACYGTLPTGAEGFCVYFSDTFRPVIQGGGAGPGLAYGAVTNINTGSLIGSNPNALNGLDSGILGVGFDITGNFGNSNYFSTGYNNSVTNSIVLRSNFASSNNIIIRTPNLNDLSFSKNINLYQQLTAVDQEPTYKRVRIRVTDFGQRIVVDIKNIDDLTFTNYLNYNFTNYNNSVLSSVSLSSGAIAWPVSVRCGLGFANGETGNTKFKIKGFNINGVFTTNVAQGTYTYDTDKATLSASVNYTYPALPFFYYGEAMATQNTYDGILNDTYTGAFSSTNPAISGVPLIFATLGTANPGAPYAAGDKYVNITTL